MGETVTADVEPPPIILEGVGWKRRSGFGKYSDSIGMGSAWERRRFALTAKPLKLSYYGATESSKSILEETPRGTLNILPERVTITATYPADAAAQPTPFSVNLKTPEGEKWKFCFDDRETQLIWLVALSGIVAEASVQEFNARVLMAEADKSTHGGFHKLYAEDDGRLLDLVHTALLSGGRMGGKGKGDEGEESKTAEAIEVVGRTLLGDSKHTSIRIMNPDKTMESGNPPNNSPVAAAPTNSLSNSERGDNKLPIEKLYQALAVVVLSVFFECCAEMSPLLQSLLWKLVNIVILCMCFFPTKSNKSKKEGAKKSVSFDKSDAKQNKQITLPDEKVKKSDKTNAMEVTPSLVAAELMKAEGVPLSDMPSFSSQKADDEAAQTPPPPHRLEPLTDGEMASHSHDRWAMSSPSVDLSGEWTLIADDAFKAEYDAYLKQLGFSGISRKVACSLIARTSEMTRQSDNGRELYLKGTNPKGSWERTLTSSGYPDFETQPERKEGEDYEHAKISIKTADSEDVDAEAWWEERGTKHRSWLRGGKKYGGGEFESLRYIEDGSDGNVLVCVSIFHPKDPSKKKGVVNWRFQRVEA